MTGTLDSPAILNKQRSLIAVVHTNASNRLPIGKLANLCLLSLLLSMFTLQARAQTPAQGANVDLNAPNERVNETSDDAQREDEGIVHLYFAFGAETPQNDSQAALRSLAELAMANPDRSLVIAAHTDNRGWALGNLELSRIRARTVARALMTNGIEIARMSAFAFGESRPVAPNSTAEGRRLNRRVEISLKP